MKRPLARDEQSAYARLIQLSDSALPIGTFSFSAALETAAAERLVVDADSLRLYVQAVVHQSLTADAVAAMAAFRAASEGDYEGVLYADHVVMMYRMGEESRRMLCRMGRRMAELGALLTGCEMVERWNSDIRSGATPGSHPVALALVAHAMGLSQRMLFASHIYGVASLPLNAALRCVKVSHYDTQLILHDVVAEAMNRYKDVASLSISDMNCFAPELDILASLHEVGSQRMFMN